MAVNVVRGSWSKAGRQALIVILLVLGSVACQTATPTMSLDEAREAPASFGGPRFTPPPRTIKDLTGLVDTGLQSNAHRIADSSMPETGDPDDLGNRYRLRGIAARRIGRFAQAVADLTRAAAYVKPGSEVMMSGAFGPGPMDLGLGIQRELAETMATSGNFWQALAQYERAIQYARNVRRNSGVQFELLSGLVQVYAAGGDLKAAERTLGELRLLNSRSNRWVAGPYRSVWDASVLRAEGAVLHMRGRFTEAEDRWRRSIATFDGIPYDFSDRIDDRRDADTLRLAHCLLRQGRLLEAEGEVRRVLYWRPRRGGLFGHDSVAAVTLLARVLREQGRYAEATLIARAAMNAYEQGGASPVSSPPVVAPRRELAALLAAQEHWEEALAEFERIRQELKDHRLFARLVEPDPAYLMALIKARRLQDAVPLTEAALQRSIRLHGDDHVVTAEVRGLAAFARSAQGDRETALREFRSATGVLLDQPGYVDDFATTRGERDQRLRWILSAYIDLLAQTGASSAPGQPDPVAEAFRLADAARARSVQRALDATAVRSAAKTPALAELVRQEQEAARQLGAIHELLATASDQSADSQVIADLRDRIATLQRARLTLRDQIVREFPAYAQLVNPPLVRLEQVQALLRPSEALIATLVAENETYVWAVRDRGQATFAVARLGRRSLETTVGTLRQALDVRAAKVGDIPVFDVRAAHELFRALLEPVKAAWESAESLMIVSDGPLAQLPLATLPMRPTALGLESAPMFSAYRAVPWLGRRHAISTLPSASALVTLRSAAVSAEGRRPFIGFGDPYFNEEQATNGDDASIRIASAPAEVETRSLPIRLRDVIRSPGAEVTTSKLGMLPRLPDTADEIRGIARSSGADPTADVFLGAAANEWTVKTTDLRRYRVVAFATHGLLPGDLDGLVQPALALTAPEVAKVVGDGLLTMDEILGLRLDADWVVLSACNTANGAGNGAEALSGLGRAFFYAGTRALLVTHWPVETASARALTQGLFERYVLQPGLSRAKALQQSMNALIDEGAFVDPVTRRVVFSYAHPIFWAPFTLIGDGGSGAPGK
jgi:CHAT domain-containing protein